MKVLAFAGMPFSGKSEAVKIAKSKNIPVVRMGDMIWREVKNRNLEINDENVGFVANEMREKHGRDIWAKRTVEEIKNMDIDDTIVIDGVRNIEEIYFFKKVLGDDFLVVGIDVEDEIRYSRAMMRDREDDSKDIDKIKERDRRELGWGLKKVISSADVLIENNEDIDSFRKKISEII